MRDLSCGDTRVYLQFEVRRIDCTQCGKVKTETVPFLANNPFYTERFGQYVGERCRNASIQSVAKELRLDWQTVKSLEMDYMRAQLERAGPATPRAIGIDEISIRKGHTYRIVVSDLELGRAIWFGGDGRKEVDMAKFYDTIGKQALRERQWVDPAFVCMKPY